MLLENWKTYQKIDLFLPDTEDEESSIRYTKAFSCKIIFIVTKVVIITIRNDAEDSEDVLDDLGK